jgi:ABC-type uncharacterized transport system substrate-binding protein
MRRKHSLWIAAAVLLWLPTHVGEAQKSPRPFRIGVLNAAWAASHPTVEGLKAGLKELGFADGRDVTFDIRFTEGKLDTMPASAEALVKAGVDLIFTSQEAATNAAKDATESVPIVFSRPSSWPSVWRSSRHWLRQSAGSGSSTTASTWVPRRWSPRRSRRPSA